LKEDDEMHKNLLLLWYARRRPGFGSSFRSHGVFTEECLNQLPVTLRNLAPKDIKNGRGKRSFLWAFRNVLGKRRYFHEKVSSTYDGNIQSYAGIRINSDLVRE
jgi:hypothetical protein